MRMLKMYHAWMSEPAGGERVVTVYDAEGETTVVTVVWVDGLGTRHTMPEYRHNLRPLVTEEGMRSYRYATDSESGYLIAPSFDEACEQLRQMVPPHAQDDGGWGWVMTEWPSFDRYEVGQH